MIAAHKIRVGLVGASVDASRSWGTRAHIPALNAIPDYELIAVCTTRDETAWASARQFGIPYSFSDPRKMAEHPEVDMITVAVRAPAHCQMVEAAVAAGKHVFCDWPLGISTVQARAIAETTRKAGVRNMIGLQSEGVETLRYVKDLIADGFIGRLRSTSMVINHEPHGPMVTEDLAYVADAANGVNLLTVAGGHTISGIDYVLGGFREFSSVLNRQFDTAVIAGTAEQLPRTSFDHLIIAGTLKHGAVASIHILSGAAPRISGIRWEINGTEGDLLLTSTGPANINRAMFELRGSRGAGMDLMPVPERYLVSDGLAVGTPPKALAHLYRNFATSVRDGAPQPLDFEYALRLHEFLDAVQLAADTGQRQKTISI